MAQNNQEQDDKPQKENNSNTANVYSHITLQQSSDANKQGDINKEIYPRIKRQKINDKKTPKTNARPKESHLACDICHQRIKDLKIYENDLQNAVFEDVALTDEKLHLSIDGEIQNDDVTPTYKLINFSVYDEHRHLCRFDTGLIEDNVHLCCSGYIVPIFDEDPGPHSGVPTTDIGPINEWYTTGFDGGENVLVCISTDFAEYYLIKPSEQYQSFMHPVYEKAYMSKLVIEFLATKDDPTYEDLVDELQTVDPPKGMPPFTEESLLNNVQFICDQVTSLDIDSEDSENFFPLLTTSCMRSLVKLTGVTVGKKLKSCKAHQKSPVKNKKSWATPATTKLVHKIFEKFFPQNQSNNDKTLTRKSGSCGVCEACQMPDCGRCHTCRKKKKLKGAGKNNPICIKRRCPNKAIRDADLDSGAEEDDTAVSQNTFNIPRMTMRLTKPTRKNVRWLNEPVTKMNNRTYYKAAQVGSSSISLGDYVIVDVGNPPSEQISRVLYMWEEDDGTQQLHLNWFLRGKDTILGNIADEHELFAIDECTNVSLKCIKRLCTVIHRQVPNKWAKLGNTDLSLDEIQENYSKDNFFYRKRYNRDQARFEDLLGNSRNLEKSTNSPFCLACDRLTAAEQSLLPRLTERGEILDDCRISYGLVSYRNEEYRVGDGVYITPSTAFVNNKIPIPVPTKPNREDIDEDLYPEYYRKYFTGDHVKGSNYDTPEPFDIGHINSIYAKSMSTEGEPEDIWIEVNRMYRCEDTHEGSSLIGTTDINMLYWSDEIYEIPFKKIMGKCYLMFSDKITKELALNNRFYFNKAYDARKKAFTDPPTSAMSIGLQKIDSNKKEKRPLKTLDVFAGCGGLSEGLSKAGAANVLWAIEKDRAAARVFQTNHSRAAMFQGDCNSILDEVIRGRKQGFPQKGEVELLCGGPPCQGFSGLNRFNSTQYSYLKNTLLFTYLSYCDYYRPKFVVMENVHNFTLHSKGLMLKIALYCLLKIGYQCTFAIVQAGNFGLPQSRRRTILLAAAPGENLPNYPEPLHVFSKRASQLDVVIDGKKYSSNCFWRDSAPYRTVCVRDAISDLPVINNGAHMQGIVYGSDAKSHFQRKMRDSTGQNDFVQDHICKKMSPLVEARIINIPKAAGADWRDLPNIVVKLSDGTFTKKLEYRYMDKKAAKNNPERLRGVCSCTTGKPCNPLDRQENTLIPWCLPHTSNRQYGWAGTYGRLDWNGFFGTTITNPEPLGKQGRVLHPEQPRVVSVRECARSQGFPDNYCFEGSLIEKYRQIGNAVPPPLAEAIGYKIKESM